MPKTKQPTTIQGRFSLSDATVAAPDHMTSMTTTGISNAKPKAKANSMGEKMKMVAAAHVSHHRQDGKVTDQRLAEASAFAANGH